MKRSIYMYLILLIGASLFLVSCNSNNDNASDKKITIKLINDVDENHPQGVGSDKFKELVDERLGDKVEVEVYHNASLFDIEDGLEALEAGNIQMVSGSTANLIGYDPAYQLYDMPFLFSSTDDIREFDKSDAGEELRGKIEDSGLKILDTWFGSFKQFTNNEHPITEPEDMEGLKFRVLAGGLLEDQFSAVGAGSTVIPFGDLYSSLQQGVVDGQENTFTEIASSKLYEVQDYMTISDHAMSSYPLLTNKEFWEDIPTEEREELEDIISEVTKEVEDVAEEINDEDFETIENSDIEITELTEEQTEKFIDVFEPLYDEYEDEIGKDLMDAAREFQD